MTRDLLARDYSKPQHSLPLLRSIKHTRLEGAIVEHEVDQVLLPAFVSAGWQVIDALVLRRFARQGGRQEINVLSHDSEHATAALCVALRRTGLPVRRLALQDGQLLVLDDTEGQAMAEPKIIQPVPPDDGAPLTDPAAVAEDRVLAMFWGFAAHLGEKVRRLVLDLVIKDLYVGPYSSGLWDMDRFLLAPDGQFLYLEAKHKYPIPRHMSFGMNRGEVQQARLLTEAGIPAWHVILVKPRWDRNVSSMYLFFDRMARERALWIAGDMASAGFFLSGPRGSASADTSIYGRRRVDYTVLNLQAFRLLGSNAEKAAVIGGKLLSLVNGQEMADPVTPAMLSSARLQ